MNKKLLFLIIAITLLLPGALFAQRRGGRTANPELTVQSNVRGAKVEIFQQGNSKTALQTGTAPMTASLTAGVYNIVVTADGYERGSQNVNLQESQTVNINLQPSTVALRVAANVNGARVQVLGPGSQSQAGAGTVPFSANLHKGSYRVVVSANGFETETRQVNLQSDQNISFNLKPSTVSLRITSNVPTAQVSVLGPNSRNQAAGGKVTFSADLLMGSYEVIVSAAGYNTATRTINLTGNQNLNITLTPAMGTVNLIIPAEFLDLRQGNPTGQMAVYIDGLPQDGNRTFQIRPGNHTIRVSSGAFNVQKNITVQAGDVYNFEIFMELRVSSGK